MVILNLISYCLVMLGGINWLSIGILQFDIVAGIFGTQSSVFSRIIYVVIGLAAAYLIYLAIAHKGKIELSTSTKQSMSDKPKI